MWVRRTRDEAGQEIQSEPLPHPRQDLDGWTLTGTQLDHMHGAEGREMAVLLHNIDLHVDTPWTYQRAADMLQESGHPEMALAALDLWLSHPHAADQPDRTREVHRQRTRLQKSVGKTRR